MKTFASESELAQHVVAWLQAQHWEVYQEVQFGEWIADIVAVQGKLIWVIECKLRFGLDVMEQAYRWRRHAHFVSIATGYSKHRSHFGERLCREVGIGRLTVRTDGSMLRESEAPFNRHMLAEDFRKALNEKQKTFAAAGNNCGQRWTPFAQTCSNLAAIVREAPGILLKDAMTQLEHHYANDKSARASLLHWAERGKVRGVRVEHEGRLVKLYPAEEHK